MRSVWIDFFEWGVRERGLHGNPARALAAPRKRDVPRETFPPSVVERIIGAQTYPADVVGTMLILRYGLRRGGLVNAQRAHFDFERRLLTVRTKGGRIYPLPLPDEQLWLALGRLDLEAQWQDDHWLLYRQDTRRMRVPLEEAEEVLAFGGKQVGYRPVTRRRLEKQPGSSRTCGRTVASPAPASSRRAPRAECTCTAAGTRPRRSSNAPTTTKS